MFAVPAALCFLVQPAAAAVKARDSSDWSSPGLAAPVDESAPKFFKTGSGVSVQILAEGRGQEAQRGDRVLVDYVLRRSNGYFLYSTVEGVSFQPRDIPTGAVSLTLGDGIVPGLLAGIEGMRPGSKRRILVPPHLGYASAAALQPRMPTFATQRQLDTHSKEALLFEVQLLRVVG